MTAWLKHHYPAEYMSSVMSNTSLAKLPKLVNSSRKMGLTLLPPNINLSQDGFNVDGEGHIVFGFRTIKGVGDGSVAILNERNANGAFVSMQDFIYRIMTNQQGKVKKNVIAALISAGAFDEFCGGNRASLLNSYEDLIAIVQKIHKYQDKMNEKSELLSNATEVKLITKYTRELEQATEKYNNQKMIFSSFTFGYAEEDLTEKLKTEHKLLGFYFSGSPLEEYSDAINGVYGRISITDALEANENTKVKVCGIISNVEILYRKKDNKPFASFTLVDDSDEIEVKCFVNKYETLKDKIEDNTVALIIGRTRAETAYNTNEDGIDDEEETQHNILTVESVELLSRNTNEKIIIAGDSPCDWVDNYQAIKKYESRTGNIAFWCDNVDYTLRQIKFRISKDIINAKIPNLSISLSKH